MMTDNDEGYDNGDSEVWAGEEESDDYVRSIYESLRNQSHTPPEKGWFIPDLALFHTSVSVVSGSRFSCTPRDYDQAPGDVPANHPVRAISRLMHDAPDLSVVRIYAYSLTDPYVIDMIAHYARSKQVKIIMHPDQHTIRRIQEFCNNTPTAPDGSNPRHLFSRLVEIRAFPLDSPHCNEFTAMHGKSIITESLAVVGSYNLSVQARCKNREFVYCVESTDVDKAEFDAEWQTLEGRKADVWNADPKLFERARKRKR